MSTPAVICPHFGCEYVFHSHRRAIAMPFLRLFQLIAYCCDSCERRFYKRREKPHATREGASSLRPAA